MLWDRDAGAQAVARVTPEEIAHASDQLKPYHGKTNPWGARSALVSTVGFLRQRYEKARCDSDGVSACVRCQTMFLVVTIERLLAAQGIEAGTAETEGLGPKDESPVANGDAPNP